MNELPSSLWIVLGGIAGLQVVLLLLVARLSGRVKKLASPASAAASSGSREPGASGQKERNAEQKQWFAVFLDEDPARREWSKKEQFEAFRRWRGERGLNWRTPDESA